jgi:class 3 adenylate cyclase/TolB-like protein/Tfp pilus assembly protein PilF
LGSESRPPSSDPPGQAQLGDPTETSPARLPGTGALAQLAPGAQRRLAAILFADIVGSSALMGEDEEGTVLRIKALLRDLVQPKAREHQGRIVRTSGDGVVVEFMSPVEAVRYAVELQEALVAQADDQGAQPMQIRVGIHLADVIVDDGDVHGQGVNVAARLEQLAAAGEIWISAKVFEEVRDTLPYTFQYRGEHDVKNILRPVSVYTVSAHPDGLPLAVGPGPRLNLPNKPSIAILPFVNEGGDPHQQYFSNGFADDIITELYRFRGLSVLSYNTSVQFRNASLQDLSRDLKVQFALLGSIRRRGASFRISCRLLEAATGALVWAEHYDETDNDVFDVQDKLVGTLVGTLVGRIQAAGAEKARRKPPSNLAAYECVLRANALPLGDINAEREALGWYRRAIELDPTYGRALAKVAHFLQLEWLRDMGPSDAKLLDALDLAKQAEALSPDDPICLNILGWIYLHLRDFETAKQYYKQAIDLNPNDPEQVSYEGTLQTFLGNPDRALEHFQKARALDRFYNPPWFWPFQGLADFTARRFERAITRLNRSPTMPVWVKVYLAASNAHLGREPQAREMARRVVQAFPDFSAHRFAEKDPYERQEHRDLLLEGLRQCGLPD